MCGSNLKDAPGPQSGHMNAILGQLIARSFKWEMVK